VGWPVACDPVSAPDATKPVGAGTVLSSRYRLVRLVAQGGMASVWEAHDNVLARSVAVKMLHPHLAEDKLFLERFRREAVSAARLAHPNVVATFDAGVTPQGTAFIVMELIRGQTLSAFAADHRPLPIFVCVEIGMQIAEALAHAHAAGLIHRDIKPANVLVCDTESDGVPLVKVTDFGIAKAAEGLGLELTKTGMILGTPKYLCPEQIEGREPDARGDLYSLGVVLFELVTGVAPFRGPTEMAVAVQHMNDTPPPLRQLRPGAPAALEDVVTRMLAKRPEDRPPSAMAVRQALSVVDARGRHDRARSPTIAASPPGGAGRPAPPPPPMVAGPTGSRAAGPPAPTSVGPGGAGRSPSVGAGGAGRPAAPNNAYRPPPPPPGGGPPRAPRTRRPPVPRRPNWTGRVVAGLVVLALIVVVVVVASRGTNSPPGSSSSTSTTAGASPPIAIANVVVFHTERNADDAANVGFATDGNLNTSWQTDRYFGPHFAGLHHGLGLAFTLVGPETLHSLHVITSTIGWSAEVYVSNAVPNPPTLAPWGAPVDSQQGINGSTTFNLHSHQGGAILLWLTDLGPTFQASVAEVTAY
jgi:tRNA A-37 threonylcarbamoyl transferase component Bud32